MFGFVAYQLWGTGIENAASQRALSNEFEDLLASVEPVTLEPIEVEPPTDGRNETDTPISTSDDVDAQPTDVETAEGPATEFETTIGDP